MTGFLVGLSCGALIGWAARVARERSRFRRIREAIMDELARQEARRKADRRGMDRWAVERLLRRVEEDWQERYGE